MNAYQRFRSLQLYVLIYPLLYFIGHYFIIGVPMAVFIMAAIYAGQLFRFLPIWSTVNRYKENLFKSDKRIPAHDPRSFHFATPALITAMLGFMFGLDLHSGILIGFLTLLLQLFLVLGAYYAFQSIEVLVQHVDDEELYRINIRTDNRKKQWWQR